MRSKTIDSGTAPTYVLVLDPGDEAVAVITSFARERHLSAAQITAIGAFEQATIGWFDRDARQYRPIGVDQQCEVLSLVGDIAVGGDGPTPHLHAVLGLPDGSTRGGHLLRGQVWPTLEVIIRDTPAELQKTDRPDSRIHEAPSRASSRIRVGYLVVTFTDSVDIGPAPSPGNADPVPLNITSLTV